MSRRLLAIAALGIGLTLAGCSAGSGGAGGSDSKKGTGSAESPTADGRPVGGPDSGFELVLPQDWKEMDPTQNDAAGVKEAFGLNAEQGELVKGLLEEQKRNGAVFAIDPATETGAYASHVVASCEDGGLVGADLETLRKKAQELNTRLGAENLQVNDVTVAGKPGIKVTYNSTSKPGGVALDNTEVQVPTSDNEYCLVNVRAEQGRLPDPDRITDTFKPL